VNKRVDEWIHAKLDEWMHELLNYLVQESEGEDAADSRVTLAQDVGRGNLASRQSRVKLQEVIICCWHTP